ncbi:MAG: hypothetical protein ACYTGG_04620 [Planctomycetota bacterium]|jgi:hypothetical protein
MSDPTAPPPDGPAAPPTVPGDLSDPARRAVWPTIFGVIAIVFGSCGLLHGGVLMLMPVWKRLMESTMPESAVPNEAFTAMDIYAGLNMVLGGLMAVLGVALLAGGIGLLRRRRWAAVVLVIWAILKMLASVFYAVVTYLGQEAQFEAMSASSNQQLPAAFGDMMQIFSVAVSIGWYSLLPAVMLIWLTRRPIREQMAAWEIAPSRPAPVVADAPGS